LINRFRIADADRDSYANPTGRSGVDGV